MENVPHNKLKRRPKNPIRFQISLNDEQKAAKQVILENDITVLRGKAGSGKTLLAVQCALDQYFNREVEHIIITRPTVSKEDIGHLPGDMKEKMDPWLSPIYANMYSLYNKDKVDAMIDEGTIEIAPLSFMRGRTFVDSFIVVDEAQNILGQQMEMIMSRLGKGSKMVICGDRRQIDLKKETDSGFGFLTQIADQVDGFAIFELQENHRHPIVDKILEIYDELRNDK